MAAGSPDTSTIKIFARVRPQRPSSKLKTTPGRYWIDASTTPGAASNSDDAPRIGFHVPRDESAGLINNQRESYEFKFDGVFGTDSNQEEVFDTVAKPVVQSCLEGYNGTIFAYGQTGSGKTFTITGGAERYADRGLIPRTLQYIFKQAQKNPTTQYTFHVSYLEIYNEVGYDLLDSSRDAKRLEDLPKVTLQEDADEMIHLRNLSVIPVSTEEEALNLLFVGDTNRMIAETPSNPSSSRSHCIFVVGVTSRRDGEDVIRKSKLHLVDLAGSERVSRTGIEGILLKEAKYINLSLHYLEQVIIALHEQSMGKRTHVPYRNSMMTSVLRDSLGGNCKTTMIATVAVEDQLIDESISTCRFAQRVALISNTVSLNEELDPYLVIARLKREIARLRAELAIARGDAGDPDKMGSDDELPDYEKQRVKQAVDEYISDTTPDSSLILSEFRKIQHAFSIFKSYCRNTSPRTGDDKPSDTIPQHHGNPNEDTNALVSPSSSRSIQMDTTGLTETQLKQIDKLKMLIAHRDNEINILVGMIRQLKSQLARHGITATNDQTTVASNQHSDCDVDTTKRDMMNRVHVSMPAIPVSSTQDDIQRDARLRVNDMSSDAEPTITVKSLHHASTSSPDLSRSIPTLSTEKAKAFEMFRQAYPASQWIDGQKRILKTKYTEAKTLGEQANKIRLEIKTLKTKLSQQDSVNTDTDTLRQVLSIRISEYKHAYTQLKDLKIEIEHLQHLLEQARCRLTRDFEAWYVTVYLGVNDGSLESDGDVKTAPASGASARLQTLLQARHDGRSVSNGASDSDVASTLVMSSISAQQHANAGDTVQEESNSRGSSLPKQYHAQSYDEDAVQSQEDRVSSGYKATMARSAWPHTGSSSISPSPNAQLNARTDPYQLPPQPLYRSSSRPASSAGRYMPIQALNRLMDGTHQSGGQESGPNASKIRPHTMTGSTSVTKSMWGSMSETGRSSSRHDHRERPSSRNSVSSAHTRLADGLSSSQQRVQADIEAFYRARDTVARLTQSVEESRRHG